MPAGQGPAERGRDAERFAAAVEQGRPPASADAELSRDLEIVAMLRSRGPALGPHPDAKARAKQRLMAALDEPGAPATTGPLMVELTAPLGRLLTPSFPNAGAVTPRGDVDQSAVTARMAAVTAGVDQPGTPAVDPAEDPAGTSTSTRRGRHTLSRSTGSARPARAHGPRRPAAAGARRRGVLVGSAALVMMIALTGAGVFASQDALPGNSLYALKRAAESASLALTFDDESRARRHLELATTRLDEVEGLVSGPQPQAPPDPELVQSTIRDFGTATGEGSRTLMASDDAGGAAALDDLRTWAAEQAARLSALRDVLPAPAIAGADDSIQLLGRLVDRADALEDRSSCTEVTQSVVDDLGRLPSEGVCAPRPVGPGDLPDGTVARTTEGGPTTAGTAGGDSGPGGSAPGPDSTEGGTGSPPGGQDPGLLPDLGGPVGELPGRVGVDSATGSASTTPSASGTEQSSSLPPPLLPPITLPPLFPGQPGITIG